MYWYLRRAIIRQVFDLKWRLAAMCAAMVTGAAGWLLRSSMVAELSRSVGSAQLGQSELRVAVQAVVTCCLIVSAAQVLLVLVTTVSSKMSTYGQMINIGLPVVAVVGAFAVEMVSVTFFSAGLAAATAVTAVALIQGSLGLGPPLVADLLTIAIVLGSVPPLVAGTIVAMMFGAACLGHRGFQRVG
jgi:hypothetical protein